MTLAIIALNMSSSFNAYHSHNQNDVDARKLQKQAQAIDMDFPGSDYEYLNAENAIVLSYGLDEAGLVVDNFLGRFTIAIEWRRNQC